MFSHKFSNMDVHFGLHCSVPYLSDGLRWSCFFIFWYAYHCKCKTQVKDTMTIQRRKLVLFPLKIHIDGKSLTTSRSFMANQLSLMSKRYSDPSRYALLSGRRPKISLLLIFNISLMQPKEQPPSLKQTNHDILSHIAKAWAVVGEIKKICCGLTHWWMSTKSNITFTWS